MYWFVIKRLAAGRVRAADRGRAADAYRAKLAAIGACEIGAEDQRQIERLGDGFDAADQIDR